MSTKSGIPKKSLGSVNSSWKAQTSSMAHGQHKMTGFNQRSKITQMHVRQSPPEGTKHNAKPKKI